MSHVEAERKCKCVLLSEKMSSEKATYRMMLTIRQADKSLTMETVKRAEFARD